LGFRHDILGFLLDFPSYGYDMMKKMFSDFVPINQQVNEGRLYSVLQKMEQEQLIKREINMQQNLPNQKIIHITPAGEKEFFDWLDSWTDETDPAKFDFFKQYPFLSKVNYFKYLSPEKIHSKLKNQLRICQKRLERFQKARDDMHNRKVDHYRVKIVEYGIEVEKIRIRWLQDLQDELEGDGEKHE